ncbi:MAG: GDP-mannose 4,6-dehydratase [Candidatus Kaiserbacteria bacterium]|nr:GDP-mannose 4,6-dehydratase [Candidatus Kaiserbacteria bacterium]
MKTVLVTGAAGFIGSNLAKVLLDEGYRVVGIDNFDDTYDPCFKEDNITPFLGNPNFKLARVDIRDIPALTAVFETEKPSYVVHLAGKADTRKAVDTPRLYISVNIDGTLNILELCRECLVENFVVASSSSVYGNSSEVPFTEDQPADRPISPYGATKRSIELFAHTYHHNFGMNITCLRFFNAIGENNRPGMVPYIWAEKILHGEEIEISGDGNRKRDYTYVGDIVRGIILAMKKPFGFEIINLGNNTPVSLNELLAIFEKVVGVKAKIKSRPSHGASVEITCADVSKAKNLLDWVPTTSLEEGIVRLVAWFRANRLKESE